MYKDAVLVTGATGYVGGRLVPRLLADGYRVKAMGRSLSKLASRPWADHPMVELAEGDVLNLESLNRAAKGCRAAYYLVHSMIAQDKKFAEADRKSAQNMVKAGADQGLERIIYLGGLGDITHPEMSDHLRSRHEVGDILQSGPVPTTVLRAAMILGSGSASFEILRYLVERLPVMITPKWVSSPCQPISISSVLTYLQGCLENDDVLGQTFDIGDNEVLAYRQIIDIYAEEARLPKRWIIPVPVLTPKLSAYWIHLVTPVPSAIAMPLTEGLSVPVVCKDDRIRRIIPLQPSSCRETIRKALQKIGDRSVETCWSDAGCLLPPEWAYCGDAEYTGGTILRCGYKVVLQATPEDVWAPIGRIGGDTGWYYGNLLWRLRGEIDRIAGGVGLRRGRRHPSELMVGDALDFWRVSEIEPPHKLVLLAEMKLPGEALMEIDIRPMENGQTELKMLSKFVPRGLGGMIYWYTLYPFHELIFKGMLEAIAKNIRRPITFGPVRFTPRLPNSCAVPKKPS
ncbi:SDR family oxidoreductase [Thermodesulfobacteriota bacterium]